MTEIASQFRFKMTKMEERSVISNFTRSTRDDTEDGTALVRALGVAMKNESYDSNTLGKSTTKDGSISSGSRSRSTRSEVTDELESLSLYSSNSSASETMTKSSKNSSRTGLSTRNSSTPRKKQSSKPPPSNSNRKWWQSFGWTNTEGSSSKTMSEDDSSTTESRTRTTIDSTINYSRGSVTPLSKGTATYSSYTSRLMSKSNTFTSGASSGSWSYGSSTVKSTPEEDEAADQATNIIMNGGSFESAVETVATALKSDNKENNPSTNASTPTIQSRIWAKGVDEKNGKVFEMAHFWASTSVYAVSAVFEAGGDQVSAHAAASAVLATGRQCIEDGMSLKDAAHRAATEASKAVAASCGDQSIAVKVSIAVMEKSMQFTENQEKMSSGMNAVNPAMELLMSDAEKERTRIVSELKKIEDKLSHLVDANKDQDNEIQLKENELLDKNIELQQEKTRNLNELRELRQSPITDIERNTKEKEIALRTAEIENEVNAITEMVQELQNIHSHSLQMESHFNEQISQLRIKENEVEERIRELQKLGEKSSALNSSRGKGMRRRNPSIASSVYSSKSSISTSLDQSTVDSSAYTSVVDAESTTESSTVMSSIAMSRATASKASASKASASKASASKASASMASASKASTSKSSSVGSSKRESTKVSAKEDLTEASSKGDSTKDSSVTSKEPTVTVTSSSSKESTTMSESSSSSSESDRGETTIGDTTATSYTGISQSSSSSSSSSDEESVEREPTPEELKEMARQKKLEEKREEEWRKFRMDVMKKFVDGSFIVAGELGKASMALLGCAGEAAFTCLDVSCTNIGKVKENGGLIAPVEFSIPKPAKRSNKNYLDEITLDTETISEDYGSTLTPSTRPAKREKKKKIIRKPQKDSLDMVQNDTPYSTPVIPPLPLSPVKYTPPTFYPPSVLPGAGVNFGNTYTQAANTIQETNGNLLKTARDQRMMGMKAQAASDMLAYNSNLSSHPGDIKSLMQDVDNLLASTRMTSTTRNLNIPAHIMNTSNRYLYSNSNPESYSSRQLLEEFGKKSKSKYDGVGSASRADKDRSKKKNKKKSKGDRFSLMKTKMPEEDIFKPSSRSKRSKSKSRDDPKKKTKSHASRKKSSSKKVSKRL